MKNFNAFYCVMFLLALSACSSGEPSVGTPSPLAENAPADQPFEFNNLKEFDSLVAPYREQARQTLPESKKRYLGGLEAGEVYYVTVRLCDNQESGCEDVYVEVNKWENDRIEGIIASDLNLLHNYVYGQRVEVAENEILDWTISKPDGTEDGNFVGKFMDTWQK